MFTQIHHYDIASCGEQGVVGNILVLESFGAAFPHIYMDASLKVGLTFLS